MNPKQPLPWRTRFAVWFVHEDGWEKLLAGVAVLAGGLWWLAFH